MRPIIVYRDGPDWWAEADAASNFFPTTNLRPKVKKNDLVIPRFSAWPFYKEQERDFNYVGAKMINSYRDHEYIADLMEWYYDLEGFTPKTWFELHHIPEKGPFVLKGQTNSRKFHWNSLMFAKDKKEAIEIHSRLIRDSLLEYQKIYIRKYIPLKTFMIGLQGLPITNEYRFFCYKKKILSGGFYWSSHFDQLSGYNLNPAQVPREWLQSIVNIVSEQTNYFVIDVAETDSGDWIVIELNDGSQSGLSQNKPEILYNNLKNALLDEIKDPRQIEMFV